MRVLASDDTEHAELHGSVRLPGPELLARRRLVELLHAAVTVLGR